MYFLQGFTSVFPSLFHIPSAHTSTKVVQTSVKPLNKKKKVKSLAFQPPKMIDRHITMKHFHTIPDAVPRRMKHR